MSSNQLTVKKRPQEEIIMKSGNNNIKVDLPKSQPPNNFNFNPQSLPRQTETSDREHNRSRHQSIEIEKSKQPSKPLFDQPIQSTVTKQKYSVEELLRSAPSESSNSIILRSRGYTLLKNYLKEMHECGMTSSFNSRNYQIMKNLQNNNATLLAAGKDSFVPTILQKNVNEWDENSEIAFQMKTKTILNRLTPQNIDQSIKELMPKINSDKRLEFMIFTFNQKAASEKSFSNVYAEFVKKLSNYSLDDKKIADNIVNRAIDEFDNFILNASDDFDNESSELSIGYATFIANLTKNGLIKDGIPLLTKLLEGLPVEESKPLKTHIIDMLFNFIKTVGADFILQTSQQLNKIDEVLKTRKHIKSLHRFTLIDTYEIINSVLNNNNNDNINSNVESKKNQENRNLDELKSIVRNGYASYQEDYTVIPSDVAKMNSTDFFEGSMLLFLDIKDIYDFTYYQCFVLKKLSFKKNDIIDLLIKYIRIFTEQKIVNDCPLIWQKFSKILTQMIIHSIITIEDAKKVHSEITTLNPPNEPYTYDPINDIKYFIDEYFDFSEAIEFTSSDYPSQDINLALRLPKLLNETDYQIPSFQKIIAVGIIRSIFYKLVNESEDQYLKGLANWKIFLYQTYLKQPTLFPIVVNKEIENYGLEFSCDDVVQFIST